MATPTAWLMNLDADVELSAPRHYRPNKALEQRIDGLVARMGMLVAPGDRILDTSGSGSLAEPFAGPLRVLAFCPTPHALSRLRALGLELSVPAPSLEVLREANSRAFCARVGQTLPGASYLYDMENLQQFTGIEIRAGICCSSAPSVLPGANGAA